MAEEFLPRLVPHLAKDGVTFRVSEATLKQVPGIAQMEAVSPAEPDDFDTEWLSLVLGIQIVNGIEQAFEHIEAHSTFHSDGILTQDETNAQQFVDEIDAAAVYVNASTRFTDGAQLGLGAEVAISTQRLHARGPMALRELTTYKWIIIGENHVRP